MKAFGRFVGSSVERLVRSRSIVGRAITTMAFAVVIGTTMSAAPARAQYPFPTHPQNWTILDARQQAETIASQGWPYITGNTDCSGYVDRIWGFSSYACAVMAGVQAPFQQYAEVVGSLDSLPAVINEDPSDPFYLSAFSVSDDSNPNACSSQGHTGVIISRNGDNLVTYESRGHTAGGPGRYTRTLTSLRTGWTYGVILRRKWTPTPAAPTAPSFVGIAGHGTDGYWTVNPKGGVTAHGSAHNYGSITFALNKPIVAMAATPSGRGYWLAAADGGVFGFGDARFFGSMGGQTLNKPIVGIAAAPVTSAHPEGGYWLVASDGGIFGFQADFHGSMGGQHLNKPVVGMATAPITTTHPKGGYWLVAADGGIFGFDADFKGSMGGTTLNAPVTGMAASGNGYWLVARDGGIFGFNVPYKGSLGSNPPPSGVVGMARTSTGKGYWLLAGNGAVTGFGDAAAGCN